MQSTTRRAMLGAIATVAAGAAMAPACGMVINAGLDRSAWDNAMAAFEVAKAHYQASYRRYNEAERQYRQNQPKRPEVKHPYLFGMSDDYLYDRADLQALAANLATLPNSAAAKKAIDAIRDYRARSAIVRKTVGYDALCEAMERDCDAACGLEAALMQLPAPDGTALLWKLEVAFGSDRAPFPDGVEYTPSLSREYLAQTFADMRRLLSGEA